MKNTKNRLVVKHVRLILTKIIAFAMLGVAVLFGVFTALIYLSVLSYLHPPRKPVVFPRREGELALMEKVEFTTSDQLKLYGWYIPSRNRAAIVIAHGFGNNRASMMFEARLFAQQGYGVLLYDARAHGESEGSLVTWGDHERRDIRAALDFVSARPDVDPDRIGALAFSLGGFAVAEVAAEDTRIAALTIEGTEPSAEDDLRLEEFPKWAPVSANIAIWAFQREGINVNAVRPIDRIASLSPRPVLFIYGSEDSVSLPSARRFYNAAREPKEFWVVEGAGHGQYAKVAPKEYRKRLLTFFGQALLPNTEDKKP